MTKAFSSSGFIKELAKKEILVPHLRRWWSQGKFPDNIDLTLNPNKPKDDAFHPSSHTTLCDRTLYAAMNGHLAARELDDESQLIFMVGHMYHALIQWVVVDQLEFAPWEEIEKRAGLAKDWGHAPGLMLWPKAERPTGKLKWWCTGSADIARCQIPGRDAPVLVDIKTMNANMYRQNGLPASIDLKYRNQVQLYLDWHDVDLGIILCVEKDSPHRFREVLVKRDSKVADNIYAQWDRVSERMGEGNVPECTCEDGGKCPSLEVYV